MNNIQSNIITDNSDVWEASADRILSELFQFPLAGQVEILRIVEIKMKDEAKKRTELHKLKSN
jgi:hypothetical protein